MDTGAKEVAEIGQVTKEMNTQRELIAELGDALSSLESRIIDILGDGASKLESTEDKKTTSCVLEAEISDNNSVLVNHINRIRDDINRVRL